MYHNKMLSIVRDIGYELGYLEAIITTQENTHLSLDVILLEEIRKFSSFKENDISCSDLFTAMSNCPVRSESIIKVLSLKTVWIKGYQLIASAHTWHLEMIEQVIDLFIKEDILINSNLPQDDYKILIDLTSKYFTNTDIYQGYNQYYQWIKTIHETTSLRQQSLLLTYLGSLYMNWIWKLKYPLISIKTDDLIKENQNDHIVDLMQDIKSNIKKKVEMIDRLNQSLQKGITQLKQEKWLYSPLFENYLMSTFYTNNELLRKQMNISRNTASKYLKRLTELDILSYQKIGTQKIYRNNMIISGIQEETVHKPLTVFAGADATAICDETCLF